MTGWQNFWTLFLMAGMAIYVLVFLVVTFAGAGEVRRLLGGGTDAEPGEGDEGEPGA